MAPNDKYFKYLNTFSKTGPVGLLVEPSLKNFVGLRHDIDHNLDIALDFAYHENKRGFKSTYFILHDHLYNEDPLFLEKLLQIQDYGHEVGLHLNVLAGWLKGNFNDPHQHLKSWLVNVREAGISVVGSATHGDQDCYKHGLLNSWFFSQQFKSVKNYCPVTAEGIEDPLGKNLIDYPESDLLIRDDGEKVKLWCHDMADYDLRYEAVDLNASYWSDTGKDWHRTGDPFDHDLTKGRHQVLMHPIHWLAEPRKIFFISTARVGSKFLTQSLKQSSAANVKHEWTLNHRQRNSMHVQEKMTTLDTQALALKPRYVKKLIEYSYRYSANTKLDDAEFNVYLVDYIDQLLEVCPDAEIYGVVRNGADVVASLLERDWYASKNTIRHPYNTEYEKHGLNQFQKACHYWSDATAKVKEYSKQVFTIENIAKDSESFSNFLRAIDMPVHARVLEALDYNAVDKTTGRKNKPSQEWADSAVCDFTSICGQLFSEFGYDLPFGKDRISTSSNTSEPPVMGANPEGSCSSSEVDLLDGAFSLFGMNVIENDDNQEVTLGYDTLRTGWVIMGGGADAKWNKISASNGLGIEHGTCQVDGRVAFKVTGSALFRVFYLEYDSITGELLTKKLLTQLTPGWRGKFSELVSPGVNKFCFAIHASKPNHKEIVENRLLLSSFSVKLTFDDECYLFIS